MGGYPQYQAWGVLPLLTGAWWLLAGLDGSGWALAMALLPGLVLLSTGVGTVLYAGDPRLNQFMAVAGLIGGLLAWPMMGSVGLLAGLGLLLASLACALCAGHLAVAQQPEFEGVESPPLGLRTALKAMVDVLIVGYFTSTARIPSGQRADRIVDEIGQALRVYEDAGWDAHPATLHQDPEPLQGLQPTPARTLDHAYQHLRWTSGFVPEPSLPGAQRFAGYTRNHTAHAWLLEHQDDAPRPWLVAIHGYRMGLDWLDMSLFPPQWLHEQLGLNVFMPVLPLHGHRRAGLRSGDKYLDGDFLELLHAQSQALYDLRTAARWIREARGATQMALLGYSLGGYNASLLAGFAQEFDVVIAGIPLVDIAEALWRNFPTIPRRGVEDRGVDDDVVRRLLAPVSPLQFDCQVPPAHRHVFGGTADQLLPPPQAQLLARHWDCSPPTWFAGSHLSVRRERVVKDCIEVALQAAGIIAGPGQALVPAVASA